MTYNEVQPQNRPFVGLYSDREVLIRALERITENDFPCEIVRRNFEMTTFRQDGPPQISSAIIVDYQAGVFELIRNLSVNGSTAPVIVWQRSSANEQSLSALDWGAAGVLHDNSPPVDVVTCLKAVIRGDTWIPDSLAQAATKSRRCHLSRREGQLIRLVVQGLRNKEIAYALKISEGTVKVYFSRLFKKLGVSDRYELALLGLRHFTPDSVLGAGDPAESDPMNWFYIHGSTKDRHPAQVINVAAQLVRKDDRSTDLKTSRPWMSRAEEWQSGATSRSWTRSV